MGKETEKGGMNERKKKVKEVRRNKKNEQRTRRKGIK
jgi:hypothetical protein